MTDEKLTIRLGCPDDAEPVAGFWRGLAARCQGIGRQRLAGVAAAAPERGCGGVEWQALHEVAAITFYDAMGATCADEFQTCRLAGAANAPWARHAGRAGISGHPDGNRP